MDQHSRLLQPARVAADASSSSSTGVAAPSPTPATAAAASAASPSQFGATEPFAEPAWYNDRLKSPYYKDHHLAFRAKVRAFVDKEIRPFALDWMERGEYPMHELIKKVRVTWCP